MKQIASDLRARVRYDKDTGEFRARHSQPIEPFKREAEFHRQRDAAGDRRRGAEMYRIASIPMVVCMKIKAEHDVDPLNLRTQGERAKLLRIIDSEYPQLRTVDRKLSTRPGQVARVVR